MFLKQNAGRECELQKVPQGLLSTFSHQFSYFLSNLDNVRFVVDFICERTQIKHLSKVFIKIRQVNASHFL